MAAQRPELGAASRSLLCRFDHAGESPYDEQVGLSCPAFCRGCGQYGCKTKPRTSRLLPPRSMAGQLTLDQHIGVQIPGGQPNPIDRLRGCLSQRVMALRQGF